VTAPVKLPFISCLLFELSKTVYQGWYFIVAYAPIYSTQVIQFCNLKS